MVLAPVLWKASAADVTTPITLGAATDISAAAYKDVAGEMYWLIQLTAVTGTTPTADYKAVESDTSGGTYTDIPNQVVPAQITTTLGIYIVRFSLWGRKKFIKYSVALGGTSPSYTSQIIALFGGKHNLP